MGQDLKMNRNKDRVILGHIRGGLNLAGVIREQGFPTRGTWTPGGSGVYCLNVI